MIKKPSEFKYSWLAKLFRQAPSSYQAVTLDLTEVKITHSTGDEKISYRNISDILVTKRWWWVQVILALSSEKQVHLGDFSKRKAKAIASRFPKYKEQYLQATREINDTTNEIVAFSERIQEIQEGRVWISWRDLEEMLEALQVLASVFMLSKKYFSEFPRLQTPYTTIRQFAENPNQVRENANRNFISIELEAHKDYFDQVEKYPLTIAQREAIVTHEHNTRVIAGAGSGKTSVIVAKAGYLLKKGFYTPKQILLLAFNRAAAEEMQERIEKTLAVDITANTFHAVGLKIVAEVEGQKPALAKVAEDANQLKEFIQETIVALLYDAKTTRLVSNYFQSFFAPYESEFDFDDLGDYYRYVKTHGSLTLNGEYLKSYEEVEIANFLALHGVTYQYETNYAVDTATVEYRQYQPDFYLPDYDIYIEHFGIGRDQRVAPHVNQHAYLKGMEWKRKVHEEHGTTLIQTYSYQKSEGTLISTLENELLTHGVKLQLIDPESILQKLNATNQFDPLTNLMATFLSHFKGGCYTIEQVRAQAKERGAKDQRFEVFLALFEKVLEKYKAHLAEEGSVDFNDMINRAAEYVEAGKYNSPYHCILVDEFQDISISRARLIKALRDQDLDHRLFCVGDDWQAIYRFAGSDIAIMRDFSQRFGYAETVALDRTFRFNNQIEDVATSFILQNPAQIQKQIEAHTQVDGPHVIVHRPSSETADVFIEVLEEIQARDNGETPNPSVLVLGRYNFLRDGLSWSKANYGFPDFEITFRTVHAAKGLEADYVIVLGMTAGRYGFPSEVVDDPILNAVLSEAEEYPHAEERRLFYVALTRARHAVHLVADPASPSPFISELTKYRGLVEFLGEGGFETVFCPSCTTGQLVQRTSQHGLFYGCTNYPLCEHTANACQKCGIGYLDKDRRIGYFICNNPRCGNIERQCPSCRTGRLVERNGRYGAFYGCTNYGNQGCDYTEKLH
ncbi:MAG: UvrD-helicase domain-containing protein [Chloroflexi bacterium]|nr:UvrD-helicase domain-containing protein [Chloroflexota bacterium]